nr:hypothetical protein [Tanacetum cinerariifolium]
QSNAADGMRDVDRCGARRSLNGVAGTGRAPDRAPLSPRRHDTKSVGQAARLQPAASLLNARSACAAPLAVFVVCIRSST